MGFDVTFTWPEQCGHLEIERLFRVVKLNYLLALLLS